MLLAAALVVLTSHAPADANDYNALHVDVAGDKLLRHNKELKPSDFFRDAGRKDLVDKVEEAQTSAAWTGAGISGYATTLPEPQATDAAGWAIPAAIGLGFLGFGLLFGGLITGGVVAALPRMNEPRSEEHTSEP